MNFLQSFLSSPDDPRVLAERAKADAEAQRRLDAAKANIAKPHVSRLPEWGTAIDPAKAVAEWKSKLATFSRLEMAADWRTAVDNAVAFTERHGLEAASHGWTAAELFDSLHIASGIPTRFIGPALTIPAGVGSIAISANAIVFHAAPATPAGATASGVKMQGPTEFRPGAAPSVEMVIASPSREFAKPTRVNSIVWTQTPPRPRPKPASEVEHDVGALGTLRWTGSTSCVIRTPDGRVIGIEGLDLLKLVTALGKAPGRPQAAAAEPEPQPAPEPTRMPKTFSRPG